MTCFAIHDLQMFPLTLVDIRDNAMVVARAASWKWMERHQSHGVHGGRLDRGHLQGAAHRQGDQGVAILHSTTKAIRIGRTVREARRPTAIRSRP